MTSWLPNIYIMCNPEYEPIRYQLLLKHLPARGIPIEKIRWVRGPWGSDINSDLYFTAYDPYNTRFGLEKALSFKAARLLKAEVSLNLTFFNLMRMALEDGGDKIIVFESDVVLREDFLERLKTVLEGIDEKHDGWDYISLGEGVGTRPKGHDISYFGPTKLYTPDHQFVFRCCDSMVLRRNFLAKVFQTFLPFRECLDWEMNFQMLIHTGKSVWVDPPLVEPGTGRARFISSLPS